MITSLVLTDTYKIGMDSYNKFMVKDVKVSIKEVPFVRYRFKEYTEKEIDYISKMKSKFIHSGHLAEITLDMNIIQNIDSLNAIPNIAKFIYISVTDDEVAMGFNESTIQLINRLNKNQIDRVMIKDNSTKLDTVSATKIKKQLASIIGIELDDIGICSSPLSFDGVSACLTAARARELAAKYTDREDIALPSANHECMNCCGCIRYYLVESDIAEPISNTKGNKGGSKKGTKVDSSNKREKKAKKSNNKGIAKWIM